MAQKFVEYELHIKMDGTATAHVTHRDEGANCEVVTTHMRDLGKVVSDEVTGPLCDKQHERI